MQDVAALLAENTAVFAVVVFLFGLMVGSFLNVVIHRLPIMMERENHAACREILGEDPESDTSPYNLVHPRSACPHCGHKIGALENVPVLSYLVLRGKCAGCGAKISPRYPVIELVAAVMSAIVALRFGFGWTALAGIALTWALIALSMIDFDHQLLPDSITLPLVWAGLLLSLFHGAPGTDGPLFVTPTAAIVGGAAGYLSLWSVYQLFKLATGKEGMGYGDFKLLAALGAWLGWTMLPLVVLLSAVVGAVVGIGLIVLAGRGRQVPIPFGPYLAMAGWVAMLWGDQIVGAYLSTMGV